MSQKGRRLDFDDLASLERAVRSCTLCPLHEARRNAVPGEGPFNADIMIVGEAPGRSEDEEGRPFVGAAGSLLNRLLAKAGLDRKTVYITNVVKCRPPGNRDPKPEEIEACLGYLVAQIRLVKPKVIIAVGRIAGRTLYRLAGLRWTSMKGERGRIRRIRIAGVEVLLVTTYHPAAALYNPQLKIELERDFEAKVREAVDRARGGVGYGRRLDFYFKDPPESRG